MPTGFQPIVAQPLDEQQLIDAFRKSVKDEAKFADTQFGLTYKTWKNQPVFKQSFKETQSQVEGSTTTSGEGSKENPYPFITKGTSVRYATMTPDFSPKSTVRVIGSRAGRGGKLFVNKSKPKPGIKAREYEEEIAEREQPKFQRRTQKNVDQAAKRSDHSI